MSRLTCRHGRHRRWQRRRAGIVGVPCKTNPSPAGREPALSWSKGPALSLSKRTGVRAWTVIHAMGSLRTDERAHVRGGTPAERRQRIAALERRHDAAFGMAGRDGCDPRRDPRVIVVGELEIGQRVLTVRIEAGRDENDLG